MLKIENLVNGTFKDYDHNNNGIIEYKKTAGKGLTDESLHEETRLAYKGKVNGKDVYKDDIVTLSSKKLFAAADKNKDGELTKGELTSFMGKFDLNKNGQLDLRNFEDWLFNDHKEEAEFKHFIRAYPENIVSRRAKPEF
jgi:Ca2+-binding EF-hand superfamily protein